MEEMVEVRVQGLGLDRSSDTPVVILEELDRHRILPIWIGPAEASSIAMHLAAMDFPRPLTHDLVVSVLECFGGRVDRVRITRVEENTYFAELLVTHEGRSFAIDARPSDSIAIALRADVRIFASEALLEERHIEFVPAPAPDEKGLPAVEGTGPPPKVPIEDGLRSDALEAYLRRLAPEDFGRFSP